MAYTIRVIARADIMQYSYNNVTCARVRIDRFGDLSQPVALVAESESKNFEAISVQDRIGRTDRRRTGARELRGDRTFRIYFF